MDVASLCEYFRLFEVQSAEMAQCPEELRGRGRECAGVRVWVPAGEREEEEEEREEPLQRRDGGKREEEEGLQRKEIEERGVMEGKGREECESLQRREEGQGNSNSCSYILNLSHLRETHLRMALAHTVKALIAQITQHLHTRQVRLHAAIEVCVCVCMCFPVPSYLL
jgi:hypothetical protein